MHYDEQRKAEHKAIDPHHNPKGFVEWTACNKKILLGYHKSGFSAEDVAGFMFKTDKPTTKQVARIAQQAFKQGVSLKRIKNVIK